MSDETLLLPDGTRQVFDAGEQRRGDDADPCCGCTPVGPTCEFCADPPPSLSVALDISDVMAAFTKSYVVDGHTVTYGWAGLGISQTFCLRPIAPCFYRYVGPPGLVTRCVSSDLSACEPTDGLCLYIWAQIHSSFIEIVAEHRFPDAPAWGVRIFRGSAPWDCGATSAVADNQTVRAPDGTVFGGNSPVTWSVAQGGTATVSRGTDFCESSEEECVGAGGPTTPPQDGCQLDCAECPEFYDGNFNIDGTIIAFCLEIDLVEPVDGSGAVSCSWSQIADDFVAQVYCTLDENGAPIRVFDLWHSTEGTFQWTQPIGGEDCPQAAWTNVLKPGTVTSAAVENFAAATDCNTCPSDTSSCAAKYICEFSIDSQRHRFCLDKSGTSWVGGDIDNWDITLSCTGGVWSLVITEVMGTNRTVTFTIDVDGTCPPEAPSATWTGNNGDFTLNSLTAQTECNVACDTDCEDCGTFEDDGISYTVTLFGTDDARYDGSFVITKEPGTQCTWGGDGFKAENPPYPPLAYGVNDLECVDGWWTLAINIADDTDGSPIGIVTFRAPHIGPCPLGLSWEFVSDTTGHAASATATVELT
jgi:hypothetical protein